MAAKQQLKSSKDSSLQRLISLIIHTVRTGMNAHLCPSLADLWSSGSRLSSFPLPWWSVVTSLTLCKEKEKARWVTIVLLQKKQNKMSRRTADQSWAPSLMSAQGPRCIFWTWGAPSVPLMSYIFSMTPQPFHELAYSTYSNGEM